MTRLIVLALVVASFIPAIFASYCGQSAIPFTFQVLRSGHPVLGCARPKCFGWTANGTRAGDSAQFYRVAGKEDGYLRRSDQFIKPPSKNANFVPQIAICSDDYKSATCEEGEWVGGLTPQSDPFATQVQMRCCSYQVLINAQDRGRATVKQGQLVVGGEVLENGRLVAFDYISNVQKEVGNNGTIVYYATIKRMPCFDEEEQVKETIVNAGAAVIQQQKPIETIVNNQAVPQIPQVPQQVPTNPIYGNGVQNYGQFAQQGYGVAQQQQQVYQGYPGYQQQVQQQQVPYYQDPLAQMFQQQQAQQAQQAAQLGYTPLPPFPPQMFPQPGLAPVPVPVAAVPVQLSSTVPPMTLPKLEDLPKLQIPSVEDVEQVIPPVQRAILTSVAKFFGVL